MVHSLVGEYTDLIIPHKRKYVRSIPYISDRIQICNLEREQLPQVQKLMDDDGWDYTIDMLQNGYDYGPESWICAVNSRVQVVACVSVTLLNLDNCTIGNVIVSKDYRKCGMSGSRQIHGTRETLFCLY